MSIQRKLRSRILNVLFNPTVVRFRRWLSDQRRRLSGEGHVVSVFLQIDDPYSYIVSRYLPDLAEHYDIELRLYLSKAKGDEFQPAPDMLVEYAIADCKRLALEFGIPFLDKGSLPPTEYRAGLSDAVAVIAGTDAFADEFFQALATYWRGDTSGAAQISKSAGKPGVAKALVDASEKIQTRLGHYNSAMLHYAGEWYWGVDRLHYLTDRLDALGLAKIPKPNARLASIRQAMRVSLPVRPPTVAKTLPPIEFFHSFRSPYSYLALERTFEIADAYGIEVKLRPVLPMVMRGMQVPMSKLWYIANDAYREARRRGVPFGNIADPVGVGAERCLAVFVYAESEKRGREYVLQAGRAIWSEAIDVATDKGMRKITARCGLFWPDVDKAMRSDDWRAIIEGNRESMMRDGSWGVPTLRMGDLVVWGQDRDWLLARHIEELCDTGDGILV
jgi:2-hydroxychromene-2-carboxylate isomerase